MFSPDSVLSAVVLDIVDMIAGVHPAASVHSTLVFLVVKEVLFSITGGIIDMVVEAHPN